MFSSINAVWEPGRLPPRAQATWDHAEKSLITILSSKQHFIELHKVHRKPNGFKILTKNEESIAVIQNELSEQIQSLKLFLKPSWQRTAMQTLVIRPINQCFFGIQDDQIVTDIIRTCPLPVDAKINLWKDKDIKIIKLTFEDVATAVKAKESGFKIGPWRYESDQIEHEEFFAILQCMKCFKLEDHSTSECKSPVTYCSECAGEDHTYRHCPNPRPPTCVNCKRNGNEANHRTLSRLCPVKKEVIKNKRETKKKEKEDAKKNPIVKEITQAVSQQIASKSLPTQNAWSIKDFPALKAPSSHRSAQHPPLQQQPGKEKPEKEKQIKSNNKKLTEKIMVSTILAHQQNLINPGTFNQKLRELLTREGIESVDAGNDWDSAAILEALMNDDHTPVRGDTALPDQGNNSTPVEGATALPGQDMEVTSPSILRDSSSTPTPGPRKKKRKRTKTSSITPDSNLKRKIEYDETDEETTTTSRRSPLRKNNPNLIPPRAAHSTLENGFYALYELERQPAECDERDQLFHFYSQLLQNEDIEKLLRTTAAGLAMFCVTDVKRSHSEEQRKGTIYPNYDYAIPRVRANFKDEIILLDREFRRDYKTMEVEDLTKEENDKFKELFYKRKLTDKERKELRTMYEKLALRPITDIDNIYMLPVTIFRTSHKAMTKIETQRYLVRNSHTILNSKDIFIRDKADSEASDDFSEMWGTSEFSSA